MMAGKRGSRFLVFLVVSLMASLVLAGSAVSVAFADLTVAATDDSAATISSPADNAEFEVGKTVTIKVKATYSSPPSGNHNYLYFKVKKGDVQFSVGQNPVKFTAWEAAFGATFSTNFAPSEVGIYDIAVQRSLGLLDDIQLSENFAADDSVQIKVWKSLANAEVTGLEDKAYTGSPITQKPVVKLDGVTLNPETDYDVSYASNTDVGTAAVTITGKGFYKNTASKTFQITQADIADATINGIVDKKYTPYGAEQSPMVTFAGELLVKDTDYTLSYANNKSAGTGTVTIAGMGRFTGSVDKTFEIDKVSIREAGEPSLKSMAYTGSPITQSFTLWYGGNVVEGTDFTTAYENNVELGTATVTITGIGNFNDSMVRTFSILETYPDYVGNISIHSPVDKREYDVGAEIPITVDARLLKSVWLGPITVNVNYIYIKISCDGEPVEYKRFSYGSESADYGAEYSFTPTKKGVYLIEACWDSGDYETTDTSYRYKPIAEEDFVSTARVTAYVGVDAADSRKDISGATVTGIVDKTYTGDCITQSPTVKLDGKTLVNGTDYYVSYSDNRHNGTARAVIWGKGKYTGTVGVPFTITPKPLAASMVSLSPTSFAYTGELQKPEVTVKDGKVNLMNPGNYTVVNEGGTEPGIYTVTVKASNGGDYSGTITKSYAIWQSTTGQASVSIDQATYVYDGKAKTPAVSVTFNGVELPSDLYSVKYANNINAGTAKVTVTIEGVDSSCNTASCTYSITKASSKVSLVPQTKTYTGQALAYTGKVVKSGSTGAVSCKYYSDAQCTKQVAAASVKNAGTYYVKATLAGDANHKAATSAAVKLVVGKAKGALVVKAAKKTFTGYTSKKVKISAAKAFKVTKNVSKGKVTYKKVSGSAKIAVSSKGAITIKKGLKKNKVYKVKVTATAAATANYKAAKKTFTIKIKIKK